MERTDKPDEINTPAIVMRSDRDMPHLGRSVSGSERPTEDGRAGVREVLTMEERVESKQQDAEMIGKTIGQTATERAESVRSHAHGSGIGTSDASWSRERGHNDFGPSGSVWRPSDLLQRRPKLSELWDAGQQPLRLMRRVSHDIQQVVGSVVGSTLGGRMQENARRGGQGRQQESMHADGPPALRTWTPTIETAQRENKFIVCVELPGVKRSEVCVDIKHDRLTIEGDRFPEPQHEPVEQRRSERSYGRFYRVISLPGGADPDAASAAMHDGLLEITVPISPHVQQPRRLDVSGD